MQRNVDDILKFVYKNILCGDNCNAFQGEI